MDPRFDTSKDPRFRNAPRHVRKVQVDKRFAHMFNDKRFVETPEVDPQGRRLRRDAGKLRLKEFYDLAKDAGVTKPAKGKKKPLKKKKGQPAATQEAEDEDEDEEDVPGEAAPEVEDEEEGDADADSEEGASSQEDAASEEETEDEDEEEEEVDTGAWEADDANVPRGDATRRLALMGCDWDHVSASDLLVMLRSYIQSKEALRGAGAVRSGSVNKVSIYPSDYGLQQLAKESTSGPLGAMDVAPGADDDLDTEAAEKKQTEVLRKYQQQRTKYYYAVAEVDSAATAAWIYDNLDGLDATGICPMSLDLRFIPDDLEFPHKLVGEATEVPKRYKAPEEQRSTLGHSKVKCTWDEAPLSRKRDLIRKKFTPEELLENDLQAYLASTSEEEDDKKEGAEALRRLVRGGGDDDSDFFTDGDGSGDEDDPAKKNDVVGNMEQTFSLKAEEMADKLEKQSKKQGKNVHTLQAAEEEKSVWQKYLDKKKEKRKARRNEAKAKRIAARTGEGEEAAAPDEEAGQEELEILAAGAEDDERGFNVRGKLRTAAKRAAKAASGGSFQVDTEDPRLAKVFDNEDFAIDPTHPEFRPSEGIRQVLKKKRQRTAALRETTRAETSARAARAAEAPAVEGARAPPVRAPPASFADGGGLQLFASKPVKRVAEPEKAEGAEAPVVRPDSAGKRRRRR